MLPWRRLDAATVPGGDEELRLMKRGGDFSIMLGRIELMNSRLSGSETSLATLVCERLGGRSKPRILIGGLGMGFTLRAALGELGPDATVVVAELVPAVVTWARGPMAELFADSLSDRRVDIREGDVAQFIRSCPANYDAILLDVDNGPDGLTRPSNDALYDFVGLGAARAALRSGGILAVWSSGPDRAFGDRLSQTGFEVEEVVVRAHRGRGAKHVIWLARKATAAGVSSGTRRDGRRVPRPKA